MFYNGVSDLPSGLYGSAEISMVTAVKCHFLCPSAALAVEDNLRLLFSSLLFLTGEKVKSGLSL